MRQPNVPAGYRGLVSLAPRFWLVVVLVGLGAGLAGGLLTLLLHGVQHLAFGYREEAFQQGVEQAPAWRRVVVLTVGGLVAGLGWWALRGPGEKWLGPLRGVSEASWTPGARMGLPRTVLDGVLQIVVVGLGASLGREGAPREIAAALASRCSELTGLPAEQRRLLIACGAGAGLAAVYDVPLGGAVFTLEVLLGSVALPLVIPAVVTSVLAVLVARLMLGDVPVYLLAPVDAGVSTTVFAVVAAPVAGLAAVLFVRLVAWSRTRRPTGWRLPVATTVVFTAIGALAIVFPQLLGNGKGPTQLTLDGGGGLLLLALLTLGKPLATAACLRSGAGGGLFTPTLATGALLGAVLGRLWGLAWPGGPLSGFVLAGAAAFLAAALQAPVAAVVLLLELTRVGQGMVVPLALAAAVGTVVARLVESRSTATVGLPDTAVGAPDPLALEGAPPADPEPSGSSRTAESGSRVPQWSRDAPYRNNSHDA